MKLQSQKGNVIIWIAIAVLSVLVAVSLWWWYIKNNPPVAQQPEVRQPGAVQQIIIDDTTENIQNDLNSVDTGANLKGDLDKELDADINSL